MQINCKFLKLPKKISENLKLSKFYQQLVSFTIRISKHTWISIKVFNIFTIVINKGLYTSKHRGESILIPMADIVFMVNISSKCFLRIVHCILLIHFFYLFLLTFRFQSCIVQFRVLAIIRTLIPSGHTYMI